MPIQFIARGPAGSRDRGVPEPRTPSPSRSAIARRTSLSHATRQALLRRDELIRHQTESSCFPTELDPDRTHRPAQISTPVLDGNGAVVMTMATAPIGTEFGPPGTLQPGQAPRAAADRVTDTLRGAPPVAA